MGAKVKRDLSKFALTSLSSRLLNQVCLHLNPRDFLLPKTEATKSIYHIISSIYILIPGAYMPTVIGR